jgi:hypothetical protein
VIRTCESSLRCDSFGGQADDLLREAWRHVCQSGIAREVLSTR